MEWVISYCQSFQEKELLEQCPGIGGRVCDVVYHKEGFTLGIDAYNIKW